MKMHEAASDFLQIPGNTTLSDTSEAAREAVLPCSRPGFRMLGVPVLDDIGPPACPENVPLTVSSNCIIPNEMLVYVVVRFFTRIFDSVPVRCHDWNLKV